MSSIFLIVSCNNEEKNSTNKTVNTELDLKDKLIVTIEGVFPKNDRIQLFYSNDTNFDEKSSIYQSVYGQTVLQKVVFILPNNVKPQNLRLDLGENKNQTSLTIKDITIEYNGVFIEHEPETFRDYFEDTYYTVFNSETREYDLKMTDDNLFDPILMGTDKLKKGLNSIYNQSKNESKK